MGRLEFIFALLLLKFIDANQNVTKKPNHHHHNKNQKNGNDYEVIGAHAQVQMNQFIQFPNVRSTTQQMFGQKPPPNFRMGPRVSLPDNWDRNPFLFQTYKYSLY